MDRQALAEWADAGLQKLSEADNSATARRQTLAKWADDHYEAALDAKYPWRKVKSQNGVFLPETEADYNKLPAGAPYMLPESERFLYNKYGGKTPQDFGILLRTTHATPRAADYRKRSWHDAKLHDEPAGMQHVEGAGWVPKTEQDLQAERARNDVIEASNYVSGNSLGRTLQRGQLAMLDVAASTLGRPYHGDAAAEAAARRTDVFEQAVNQKYNVGTAERVAGTVASAAGQIMATLPAAAMTGGAAPFITAGAAGLTTANREYQRALDQGMPAPQAFDYAAKMGGTETAVATVFSAVGKLKALRGLGGAEEALTPKVAEEIRKSVAKYGVLGTVTREAAKSGAGEAAEEVATKYLQDSVQEGYGFAPDKSLGSYVETALTSAIVGGGFDLPSTVSSTKATQGQIAAELKTPEGAATWAAENPERARQIVDRAKQAAKGQTISRTDLANLTGTGRGSWGDFEARRGVVQAMQDALKPKPEVPADATTPAVPPTPEAATATAEAAPVENPPVTAEQPLDAAPPQAVVEPPAAEGEQATMRFPGGDEPVSGEPIPQPAKPTIRDKVAQNQKHEPGERIREVYRKRSGGHDIGEIIDPQEQHQPAVDFYANRGKQVRFFNSPGGAAAPSFTDTETGTVYLNTAREGDALHRSMAHEYAHGSGADSRLADLPDDVLKPYADAYLGKAAPPYRAKLEADPVALRREAAAEFMQDVFANPELRARIRTANPTLWQKIVDAVRRMIGTARSKAEQRVIDEFAEKVDAAKAKQAVPDKPTATAATVSGPSTTGTKYAKTEGQRAEAGDTPREQFGPRSPEQRQQEAVDELAAYPGRPYEIIADMNAKPRPLTDKEDALLNARIRELKNDGDIQGEDRQEWLDLNRTVQRGHSEWGYAGHAAQVELASDFSVEGLTQRHVRDVGSDPTPEQMAKYAEMADRIKELEGQVARAEVENVQAEIDRRISEAKNARRQSEADQIDRIADEHIAERDTDGQKMFRALLDDSFEQAKQEDAEYRAALAEARRRTGLHSGNVDRIENRGQDHTKIPGFAETARELANDPSVGPYLGLSPTTEGGQETADHGQELWNALRNPRPPVTKTSDAVIEAAKAQYDEWDASRREGDASFNPEEFDAERIRKKSSPAATKKGTKQEQLQKKVSDAVARFKAAFAIAPPKPTGDESAPGLMFEGTSTPQTETPAFKKWFGDSKVVDADGKPLVVYHGTSADFNAFDKSTFGKETGVGWLGNGFYFTPDESVSRSYGAKSMPVYLSLQNPFVFPDDVNPIRFVKEHGGKEGFADWVKARGHDGIISNNVLVQAVAFDPTQIKSATGNSGAFDAGNPDIMLEGSEDVSPAAGLVRAYREAGVRSFPELVARATKDIGELSAEQMQALQDEWGVAAKAGAKPDPAEVGQLARDLTRSVVESGIDQREDVIDAVHNELTGMGLELTRSQTMEAMSGYGEFRELSKDEISVKIRGIKGEIQQLLKLEDMQSGRAPKKTGVERREPTDAERQLIKQVNEAKKRGGYRVTDPAQQLKSALDAAKTAARNRITDLEKAIATREKIVAGQTALKPDAELTALRERRDALNGEYKKIFPPKKTGLSDSARLQMAERMLDRAIADLKADLNAGRLGPKPKAVPLASPELDAKRKELADLKQRREEMRAKSPEYQKQETAKALADRAKSIDRRIAELQADLGAGRLGPTEKPAPPTSPEIEAKQRQLDALKEVREQARAASPEYQAKQEAKQTERYKKALERQLAFWNRRLSDANAGKLPEKKVKKTPTDDAIREKRYQIELVKRETDAAIEEAERANRNAAGKAIGFGGDLLDLSRAVMTGFELSAVLRQGAAYTLGFPQKAFPALWRSIGAAFSRRADFAIHDDLMKRANHADYVRGGLDTTATEGPLTNREEAMRSRIASWLSRQEGPVWALPRWAAEGVLGGERAFRSFLNTMRADLFDYMKAGVEASRPGTWSESDAKVVANAANLFSGRAPTGNYGIALSRIFFAPQWVWSRIKMPFHAASAATGIGWKGDRATRLAVGKAYVRAALGVATYQILKHALYSALADDEEQKPKYELDPRSSDFGKTQLGETRLDSGAGFNQLVVFAARILSGESKLKSGEIVPLRGDDVRHGADDANKAITRFLRSKLAPLPSAVWDFAAGENIVGEKVTVGNIAADRVTPMTWRDIWDAEKELNVPQGTVAALEAFFGTGLNTHGDRTDYRDADEAGRKEIYEKGLENMEWDSPTPAYASFLTAEQRKQVEAKREERRQNVIAAGLADKPERSHNDTDRDYQKKLDSHRKAVETLRKMTDTLGLSHDRAQQMLVDYYRRIDEKGKRQTEYDKRTGSIKDSYRERAKALSKYFGEAENAWREWRRTAMKRAETQNVGKRPDAGQQAALR